MRIPAIDGLRGIAALGVVLFHLRPIYTFWLWTMVDLFFVISGFVITRLLLEIPRLSGRVLWNFWLRRALRIWPVYFFTLAATFALGSVLYRVGMEGPAYSGSVWKFLVFLQFTELYDPAFPLKEISYLRFFFISWSLAVEEQFYLVWPLLIALLRPRPAVFVVVCLGLAAGGVVTRAHGIVPLVLATRMDGLALGSLAAWLVHALSSNRLHISLETLRLALGGVALAGLILLAPFIFTGYQVLDEKKMFYDYPLAWVIFGFDLVFVSVILSIVLDHRSLLGRMLACPSLVYLGSISFAIYMFHSPLLGAYANLMRSVGVGRGLWLDAFFLIALIGTAHLSREWLEKPFNQLKDRLPLDSQPRHTTNH
jgi:peptidoglycan/LPS O-acetylase OafA/YrhL